MLLSVVVALIAVLLMAGLTACGGEPTATTTPTESQPADTGGTALTVINGTEVKTYSLADIKAMSATEGWGGIMNSSGVISGPFRQKGAAITELLDEVGGITEDEAVRITAKDGYAMTYSYDQMCNGNFTTLDCSNGQEVPHDPLTVIIAYEEDGVPLTDEVGPLRVAILNSNTQVTEGHWWVKWVEQIEVVSLNQPWTLHLEGAITEDIDNATFESGAAPGCHGATWTDDQGHEWEGIPLWLLVGRVDDDNPHGKDTQAFNDAVADAGYEVQVIAVDGYTQSFTSAEVKRNNDLIVAYLRDGLPVPDKHWPLRLVGPNLEKSQMVGQIATIKLILP
jgi:DMSO/TMAO reductase YedYZ molybdopterin-dependent catalytic subunit